MLKRFQCNHFAVSLSLIAFTASLTACKLQAASRVSLQGAGASFPAPLYDLWFRQYKQQTSGLQVHYDSVGSGAGIQRFLEQSVDFAATDVPLTDAERAQLSAERGDPIQLPIVGGAVVFAYHLPEVNELQLSREAYCGIATGEITQWNDPIIAADNPNIPLPDAPVHFVHRADGSGTTFILTNHLTQACSNWTAGAGQSVVWSVGEEALGNEGVTAMIKQTEGAIGYIGFTYAERNFLKMAVLENKAGYFIEPSPNSAEQATRGAQLTQDLTALFPDPEGGDAYPIIGLSYLLMYERYSDAAKVEALSNLIEWALTDGREIADALGYAPLSQEMTSRVQQALGAVEVGVVP